MIKIATLSLEKHVLSLNYQIRSISSFKSFSREAKKYLLDQAQAKYFQRH